MTSRAVALHFSAMQLGETLVAAIFIAGALAQVLVVPLVAPLFETLGALKIGLTAAACQIAGLAVMCSFPRPVVLIGGTVVTAIANGMLVPAVFVIAEYGVEEVDRVRVYSSLDTARLAGGFIGPLSGGLLLDYGSIRTALGFEIGAVAVAIIVLASFRSSFSFVPIEFTKSTSLWHRVREVPALLYGSDEARRSLLSVWSAIIFTSIFNVALVFFAIKTLALSGFLYAVLAQAFIVGRIVGARFSSRIQDSVAYLVVVLSGIGMGMSIAVPGLFPSLYVSLVFLFIAGGCNSLQVAALRIVVVKAVPEETKAKALSTMGALNNSAMLVGYFVGGPVVAMLSPTSGVVVSGCGTALMTLVVGGSGLLQQKRCGRFLRTK